MSQTPTISIHNWTGKIVSINFTNGSYTTPQISIPPSALATFPYYYSDEQLTGDLWVLWESSRFQMPVPRVGARQGYLGFLVDPTIDLPSGDATAYTYAPAGYREESAYIVWRNEYSPADMRVRDRDMYIALPLYTEDQLQAKTLVSSLTSSAIVDQAIDVWNDTPSQTGLYDAEGDPVEDETWGYMFWVFLAAFLIVAIILIVVAFGIGYYHGDKTTHVTV